MYTRENSELQRRLVWLLSSLQPDGHSFLCWVFWVLHGWSLFLHSASFTASFLELEHTSLSPPLTAVRPERSDASCVSLPVCSLLSLWSCYGDPAETKSFLSGTFFFFFCLQAVKGLKCSSFDALCYFLKLFSIVVSPAAVFVWAQQSLGSCQGCLLSFDKELKQKNLTHSIT